MIRGYWKVMGTRSRPFVDAALQFPGVEGVFTFSLLVDTGADRTMCSPGDVRRIRGELGLEIAQFPRGLPSNGFGGRAATRLAEVTLVLDRVPVPLTLAIVEPPPVRPSFPMPSVLGRDVMSRFALFVEERTHRVLLLEPHEADALNLR